MRDFSKSTGVLLFADKETLDTSDGVLLDALAEDCPDVAQAMEDPSRPDLDHIDSFGWAFAGEPPGMILVNWRDTSVAVTLRATAFANAQIAALARGR